jgi:hypothetical protein
MPQRIRQRLRRITALYLLASWGAAWAAIETAGPDLLALPWAQALVGCGVAWIGGFAATLGRMVTASYASQPFRLAQELPRDAMVSVVIGMSGYWAGMSQSVSPALLALALLLGGYAGTRTLSVWVDRVLRPGKDSE